MWSRIMRGHPSSRDIAVSDRQGTSYLLNWRGIEVGSRKTIPNTTARQTAEHTRAKPAFLCGLCLVAPSKYLVSSIHNPGYILKNCTSMASSIMPRPQPSVATVCKGRCPEGRQTPSALPCSSLPKRQSVASLGGVSARPAEAPPLCRHSRRRSRQIAPLRSRRRSSQDTTTDESDDDREQTVEGTPPVTLLSLVSSIL